MGKVQENKQVKRQALLDAAYELFMEHGLSKTSIGDIASRAKVAKGTFYLYFSDKDAIMRALLGRMSYHILENACAAAEELGPAPFADKVLAVADHVIEHFRQEPLALRLVQRNLDWPSVDNLDEGSEPMALITRIQEFRRGCPEMEEMSPREIYQRTAALVSMCVTMCYSCIIEERPDTMDNMKPVLFDIIRRSL